MSVKQRIKCFVKYKGISDRQFSLSIGVSAGYINSISKSIQPDKLQSISAHYPDLNTEWLLTGEGEMLRNSTANSHNTDEASADLRKIIALLEDKIEVLRDKADRLERENHSLRLENESLKKEPFEHISQR